MASREQRNRGGWEAEVNETHGRRRKSGQEAQSWHEAEAGRGAQSWHETEAGRGAQSWHEAEAGQETRIRQRTESASGQQASGRQDTGRNRKRPGKTGKPAGAGKRIGNLLVTLLLTVVVAISLGAIGFLALQIVGKNNLYSGASSEALVVKLADLAVEFGGSTEAEEEEDWQIGDVRYDGIHYRYNQDILTFLFLGIDKMGEVKAGKDAIDGGQSDAVFLLILDPHKKKATIIGVPRDTMTEIELYTRSGTYIGPTVSQLCLQHGYGDGAEVSCERSVKAVSKLFYGLPVHGYCAINMGAIPLLNDAIGGIRLKALETLEFKDFHAEEGEELYLKGMDAYYYLHNRDTASFNSAGRRLQRQKQYLTEYAAAAVEAVKADITLPVTLYGTLSKYMVTDITVDEVGYLAPQIAGYSIGEIHTLEGSTVMGEEFEEFYPDERALYELILEVFYEEV